MTGAEIEIPASEVQIGDKLAGRFGAKDQEVIAIGWLAGHVQLQLDRPRGPRPILRADQVVRIRVPQAERRDNDPAIRAQS